MMSRYGLVVVVTLAGSVSLGAPTDKIGGEILAHQREKLRPQGVSPQQHRAALIERGLNPDNLDREDCALYVHERLDPAEIAALHQQGIAVHPSLWVPPVPGRHPLGFHLVTVPYASLDVIRDDPRFARLNSVEFTNFPANDLGLIMINADDVHAGNGVYPRDGSGVKLAIADSGVDLTHPDLADIAIGETYDVTDGVGIDNWGSDVTNTAIDHGTHVTGTAMGTGLLSGGQYLGTAQGATLYFYKIGNDTGGNASADDMIEAIDRAVSVGCDIFSMSYGGYRVYMDGSEPVEQAVDAAFAAGTACFLAAMNEADDSRHDSASVAPGETSELIKLTIGASGSPYTTPQQIRVIWVDDDPSDLNLSLHCENLGEGESMTQNFSGTSVRGTEAKRYSLLPNLSAGVSKTYILTLHNGAAAGSTPLAHCYRVAGKATFDEADPSSTILGPALADDAIAVGAWTQRNTWVDYQGMAHDLSAVFTVDTLAPFSGRGPRVNGLMKPDIVAPGTVTISCLDTDLSLCPGCDSYIIDNDGQNVDGSGPANYRVNWGTSMATPMAAGAAALLLEADPTLTAQEIRATMRTTASMGAAPNNDAGWGLIDVLAAILHTCPWDLDGSGDVGIVDFLDLLAAWGSDPGGPPDFDGDGNVGIGDFLELLANWGPCP